MVTRGTSVLIVKTLAALATFAVGTIVAFWLWERLLNTSLAGYFALAVGLLATVAVVMWFDRLVQVAGRVGQRGR